MSAVEDRLAELGLSVPEVAKPVAAYVPALQQGNLVYTSGQLPMRAGSLAATGKVGTGEGQVINGASELLGKAFGDAGVHARSAVGVAVLPLDAPVEVEIVVAID